MAERRNHNNFERQVHKLRSTVGKYRRTPIHDANRKVRMLEVDNRAMGELGRYVIVRHKQRTYAALAIVEKVSGKRIYVKPYNRRVLLPEFISKDSIVVTHATPALFEDLCQLEDQYEAEIEKAKRIALRNFERKVDDIIDQHERLTAASS